MRDITHIVFHCTATPQNTKPESILRYWKEHLKWRNPGYHFMIKADGEILELLSIDKVSNGVGGHNSHSIHISYIGGIDNNGKAIDNRTFAQIVSQIILLQKLLKQFPHVTLCGHRDFPGVTKECPSYDVAEWLKTLHL